MPEPASQTAILLVNIGSPDAPTRRAVRRYLKEFLSDTRVVNLPRLLWYFILHLGVLPFRPSKSRKAYQQIWTAQGAPLLLGTVQLAGKLAQRLPSFTVAAAMRYGKPNIASILQKYRQQGAAQIIIIPLYPQYSSTTTASVYDAVAAEMKHWRHIPSIRFVSNYHQHPLYIAAIAASVRKSWQQCGKNQLLLLSFHGLPAQLTAMGDPYFDQCHTSAKLIATELGLGEGQWQVVFQSRFGAAKWLQPYCGQVLQELPAQGVASVDIVCPGFAVDCLETLEEIAIRGRKVFTTAGGKSYQYIPALNASKPQVDLLESLL